MANEEIKEAASERLEQIAELQKTEGWQLFMQVMEAALIAAKYHLDHSKDPADAWRFLHEVKTLVDLTSWTDREILAAKEVLVQLKEEEQKAKLQVPTK